MEFILKYDSEDYLIMVIEEYERKNQIEVIQIPYSNKKDDYVEYEIKVFKRNSDEFDQIKVLELPEALKDIISKYIIQVLDRTFIANPYFDELLIFAGSEVFSYQEKLKPLACTQCSRNNLYEKYFRGNKKEYIENVKKLLGENMNPEWPFREKLSVQFGVTNLKSKLDKVDLDNLAKTILDIFKGTIYVDDSQIISLAGRKESIKTFKAFVVAIKRLEQDETPLFQNTLWSAKPNAWKEDRKIKAEANKPTRFIVYGKFEND
jgi:Holliday junction resolvase RusA-like endonuclease